MVKWTAVLAVLTLAAATSNPVVLATSGCAAKVPSVTTSAPIATTSTPTTETTAPTTGSAVSAGSSSTDVDITIDPTVEVTELVESTYRNWVGPTIGVGTDSACYRESHVMSTCPLGFDYTLETCWAECPLAYPIQCGMECIRQSDDCALEVYYKVASAATAALTAATLGIFGKFTAMGKVIQLGVKCSSSMIGLVKSIARYVRNIQVSDPQTSQDKLLAILYQTNNVVIDLPVAICTCLGIPVPANAKYTGRVLGIAEYVLAQVLANDDAIVESWDSFTAFLTGANISESISDLNATDISSLETALVSNSTCGFDLKSLTDRTWMMVADLKAENPAVSEDELRVTMSESDLVLYDIPTVTNNCMEQMIAESDEETAYETRDTLRKTFGVIVDDLVESGTSDNGTSLSAEEYAYVIADKSLGTIAVLGVDPTGLTGLMAEYLQTVCGPTEFIGEIDDGTDTDTLGFKTVGDAFNESTFSWTKDGDGVVSVTFESLDTEDVTVNIMSGGDDFDEVDVAANETVTWTSNTTALGGRTLYLDRTRPGFLGLPGTGGGSLLLWVPRALEGGHLEIQAKLNVS